MGFGICGKNIRDHFGDKIKLYAVEDPEQLQYVIVAWRTNNASDIVKNFIGYLG
jgi:hypothetical protein